VEHLRLVHFTLVAISVALVVVSSSSSPSEYARAHQQIKEIRALSRKLGPNPEMPFIATFHDVFDKIQATTTPASSNPLLDRVNNFPTFLNVVFVGVGDKPKEIFGVQFNGSSYSLWKEYSAAFQLDETLLKRTGPFEKLSDFQKVWDGFWQHQEFSFPSWQLRASYVIAVPVVAENEDAGDIEFAPKQSELVDVQIVERGTENPKHHAELGLEPCDNLVNEALDRLHRSACEYAFTGYTDTYPKDLGSKIYLPLEGVRAEIHLQQVLIELMQDKGWESGKFSESFRELDQLTRGSENLPLDSVETLLDDLEKRTEEFQAFGIKFPAEQTTRWGILVLIAVQLYFWIHLGEFVPRFSPADPGSEVAWVGVYRSTIAKVAVLASVVILPTTAIAWTGWRSLRLVSRTDLMKTGPGSLFTGIFVVLGVPISTVLSLAAWNKLRQLRREDSETPENQKKRNL
jgi:hypothetical protein